ncbi:protein SRC2 homolog [Actinidia eriantha]|uniref:protein SRC2 homolog n=1 Tax=Actinidia eriantha TaxID=165200 RepID=UPI00259102D3|nr:protein SRC2 homolog [Actinidia eriantha]
MGKSSGSVLELKLMNCKGLQAFNFFQKLSVYAVVSFISDVDPNKKMQQQQQRTPTDNQGDKDPEWNHEMRFNLNLGYDTKKDDSDFLRFDLRSELALFGDKSLGEVRVLLKDLMDEVEEEYRSAPNGIVRFVSYEVRTSDGKPNGILSFSYKLLLMNQHKDDQGSITTSSSSPINKYNGHTHMDGYPILDLDLDHGHDPHPHPHDHNHNNGGDDESYYSAMAYHQIHYPSLEMPYPAPAPAESYINYPHPRDALINSQPPSVPLPPVLPLLFQPPFPPPPPPTHHHHHHHHHHVGEGAVYPPPPPSPSPWVYAQSYPDHEAPNPLEFPGDYAYPWRLHNSYYMGDPTPHSR